MKRAIAVIAALAMIVGAIVFRRQSGPEPATKTALIVGCASVVEKPCRTWATGVGYGVRIIPVAPAIGASPVPELVGLDLFVGPEPWAKVVNEGGFFADGVAGSDPLPSVATVVVASSPVVLVARTDDATRLTSPTSAWADALDAKTRLWSERSWLSPVVQASVTVSALSIEAKTAGTKPLPVEKLAGNDLQTDAVLDALADFAAVTSGTASLRTTSGALAAMLNAREIDAVATVKAAAGNRPNQRIVTPEPAVYASISLAIRPGRKLTGPTTALTAALQQAGWDAPRTGAGQVSTQLLEGLAAQMPS
jgi:hypothetical protein